MSLILDALRKLERDKDAGESGVVVVGSVPWGGGRSRRLLVLALVAAASLALLVLAAAVWWLLRSAAGPGAGTPAAAPASTSVVPSPAPPASSSTATPEKNPATAPLPRSLALPGAVATPGPEPLASAPRSAPSDEVRLTAISQKDGRPVALINDRLVFEGDSFDGIKVLRIGEDQVEVEVRGQRRVLRF